jgi:hypothetical protein
MAKLLSDAARVELEVRRERLRLELRLCEAELRSDEALRLQDRGRPVGERPRLSGGWRDWVK